ncbi:MAG: hypothetical protein QG671_95, partial [Actinomycetota bacterium]|nr:hypothetical protein [Actinomycetota bacterium]
MNGSWTVGLSLIVVTIALHTVAVVIMASAIWRIGVVADSREQENPLRPRLIVIGSIGGVGLILAMLYGVEALLWAVAYARLSALLTLLWVVLSGESWWSTAEAEHGQGDQGFGTAESERDAG